ncbi:MAG: hypothetical protein AAGL96_01740 [Pseudomonadota bacterium]
MNIEETPVPPGTYLADFVAREGHYTDCFTAPGKTATLPQFITAFYTQPLFRAERLVLRATAGARSTDEQVRALASGEINDFAVWKVHSRSNTEILLEDIQSNRTLSWLSTAGGLHFGSVVRPVRNRRGQLVLGPVFDALLSAHKLYSRALLAGAARRV